MIKTAYINALAEALTICSKVDMHDAGQPASRSSSARSLGLRANSAYKSDHILLYRKFLAKTRKERKWDPAFLEPDASQRDYGDIEFVRRCSS